jgi:hypothetical protein
VSTLLGDIYVFPNRKWASTGMVAGRYSIEFEKSRIEQLAMAIFEIPIARIIATHNSPDQTTFADAMGGSSSRIGFVE